MTLKFRPHHFLCTVGFEGKGYSVDFVREYQRIADSLRVASRGDDTPIEVVPMTDSICGPCPNRQGDLCTSQSKIEALDRGHASVLGLSAGDQLTWGEAKSRIAERMTDEAFDRVCAPCGWKAIGVCHSALVRLRAEIKPGGKKPSSGLTILLAIAGLLAAAPLTATPAWARPKGRKAVTQSSKPSPKKDAPQTVEQIRDELVRQHSSRKARAIRDASRALDNDQPEKARKLAAPLLGDELFGDHARAIQARAWSAEAGARLEADKIADVQALGQKALDLWTQIQLRYPGSALLKDSQEEMARTEIMMAEAQYARQRWPQAEELYERAFQRLSSSAGLLGTLDVETLSNFAETCTHRKGTLCDAWISRLAGINPRGSEELRAIAQFIPSVNERSSPPHYGNRRIQTYKAPDSDQVALDSAFDSYNRQKYGQAAQAFEKFLDEFPKSIHRFRVRYWLGQAFTQQQEHEKAKKVFEELVKDSPLTYYGMIASLSSGTPIEPFIDANLPVASREEAFLYPSELQRLQKGERFLAEKAKDLALIELRDIRPRDTLSNAFLMYLATLNAEAGNHPTAFQLVTELLARGYEGVMTSYGLRLIFPVEYLDLIQKQAEANHIDPILLLSLVKQESAFNSGAVSGAGASGLMQLMPATANDTETGVHRSDLVDAETNLRVGAKYLRKLLNRFNGNIAMALAGYNAGPGAVDRWVREGRSKRGILDFIEQIPYKETREYVAGIIRNHYWYSKRLKGEDQYQPISYFWTGGANADKLPNPPVEPTPSPTPSSSPTQVAPAPAELMGPSPAPSASPALGASPGAEVDPD